MSVKNLQQIIDENPFYGMRIEDDTFLNDLEGRYPCPKCGKSRKYFCYTCYLPIAELKGKLPTVSLPLKIDIIKHKNEIDGKSTAAHIAILAAHDVKIYTYPLIPDYKGSNVVLIYPSFDALKVQQLFNKTKKGPLEELPKGFNKTTLMTKITGPTSCVYQQSNELNKNSEMPIDKVIFIDSTWNQSKGIFKDERINCLRCVVLQSRISQFWRHQKGTPRWYLSTAEAVHQFLIEIHLSMWGLNSGYKGLRSCFTEEKLEEMGRFFSNNAQAYDGQYDNLLFFFKHMYKLIHEYYDHDNLYAYKRRLL